MAPPQISKRPDSVVAQLKQVLALLGKGDFAAAEAAARHVQRNHPDHGDANNILGAVLISRKNPAAAVKYLELAARKDPHNAMYLNNLGCAYLDLGLIELAHAPLTRALSINPKLTKSLWLLGEFYRVAGKPELALPYLEKACGADPQNADYKWALGKTFDMLGRKEEARLVFEGLRHHPRIGNSALHRLAVNDRHDLASPLLAEIEARIEGGVSPGGDLDALHNGAGKIYEQNGDYRTAFAYFRKANEAGAAPFDVARYRAWVDMVTSRFTPETFAARRAIGTRSDVPVFVVGMPRSGTTLVEQIIARHPQAGGAGELDRLWKVGRGFHYYDAPDKFLATIDAKHEVEMTMLGEKYVELLQFFAPKASRIVDKLPHNFELLGLIALILPEARIVHLRRNPIDTCLSCYQTRLNEKHGYSKDLRTLGLYYREYARLMAHWREVLPLKFLDLDYERLTTDFESEARRLIAFLDLQWDPACLSFHEATAAVRTFSRNQVRNPIYQTSVGRWRRYEEELQPLVAALGNLV
ncbi:MAG: sulfotransferase [Parvibaculaceae bacterium]